MMQLSFRHFLKCLLIIAAAIPIFCGCHISKLDTPSADSNIQAVNTDLYFVMPEDIADFFKSAAQVYMHHHPETNIHIDKIPNNQNFSGNLISKFHDKTPVDAFCVYGTYDLQMFQDKALPLEIPNMKNSLEDTLAQPVSVGVKSYAYPLNLRAYGIVYNQSLFDAWGINADQMTTISGLKQSLSDLIKIQPQTGFSSILCTNSSLAQLAVSASLSFSDPHPQKLILNEGISEIIRLLSSAPLDDPASSLAQNRAAVYFGSSSVLMPITQINPQKTSSLNIKPLPIGKTDGKLVIDCDYLCINRYIDTASCEKIKDFLQFIYTTQEGTNLLNAAGILSPYETYASSSGIYQTILNYAQKNMVKLSTLGCGPNGFETECFTDRTEDYRTYKIDFDDYRASLENWWQKYYKKMQ